jgi:hypothetical protein
MDSLSQQFQVQLVIEENIDQDVFENACKLNLACSFCGTTITPHHGQQRQIETTSLKNEKLYLRPSKSSNNACPQCSRKLPLCAVCLYPIEISNQEKIVKICSVNSLGALNKEDDNDNSKENQRYIWCTKCRHGGHMDHISEWFREFLVCPFSECKCRCAEKTVVDKKE